jgi:hypothetical protein
VQFGQFDEASLDNFAGAIRLLTSQIAAIGGLPPDDLGLNTTNPASAEARRAAETVLNNRANEKMRAWGGSYERTMRLAMAVQRGIPLASLPTDLRGMETIWRDPETPTVAQTADAAVKLFMAGIIDAEQAQEDIGLTPVQRESIAKRRDLAARRLPPRTSTPALARRFENARMACCRPRRSTTPPTTPRERHFVDVRLERRRACRALLERMLLRRAAADGRAPRRSGSAAPLAGRLHRSPRAGPSPPRI